MTPGQHRQQKTTAFLDMVDSRLAEQAALDSVLAAMMGALDAILAETDDLWPVKETYAA